ncbi:MAG: LysM peptidoglycan-binding domain-containing protein [Lentisphaeria bacterium]|nr:LysM peptidoglycan-binding domain-containing protein [Lentisphaeria bacterium]
MTKTLIFTLTILVHFIVIISLFVFSGEGEAKAISKIAQPEVVKTEENRNKKVPTAIVQNGSTSRTKLNPAKSKFVNHIVQSGDYLSTIARKYKTSVYKIKTENDIKGDRIYVGQKLTIPQD